MSEVLVPIFRVTDAEVAAHWYARLGFTMTGSHRFEPTLPMYAFLARGDVQLHLSEHLGDATPNTLVYFWVDDLDPIAEEFEVTIEHAPWAREINLTDPDGNRLRVAQAH